MADINELIGDMMDGLTVIVNREGTFLKRFEGFFKLYSTVIFVIHEKGVERSIIDEQRQFWRKSWWIGRWRWCYKSRTGGDNRLAPSRQEKY